MQIEIIQGDITTLSVDAIVKGLIEGKGEPSGKRQGFRLQAKSYLSRYKEK